MIAASAAGEGSAMTSTDQVRDGFVERLFASALGTMDVFTVYLGDRMRGSTLERYAAEAGFSAVSVLPIEHDFLRFYRLDP